jgi:hypothetical protein
MKNKLSVFCVLGNFSTHVFPKFQCSDLRTAAMAGQLNSFVQKFYSLWQAGNDARLNLECHAGKAQIHLQLNNHLQPHLQPQPCHQPPSPPQQPRCHLEPSQLCRRVRCELARAAAAESFLIHVSQKKQDYIRSSYHHSIYRSDGPYLCKDVMLYPKIDLNASVCLWTKLNKIMLESLILYQS